MTRDQERACIFDLDGVLVRTNHLHFDSWQVVGKYLGHTLDSAIEPSLRGLNRSDSLSVVLTHLQVDIAKCDQPKLLEMKNTAYLESIRSATTSLVLPGIQDFLQKMRLGGIPMAVASSSGNANYILEKAGLKAFFSFIIDANTVRKTKPSPELFLNAARELQLRESRCIVIEDSPEGVEAALSGGFPVIGIGDEALLSKADLVISSTLELEINLLENVWNKDNLT